MASLTALRRVNMVRAFTTGGRTVMTAGTRTNNLRMINSCRGYGHPGRGSGCMTRITLITTVDVIGSFATGDNTIMTADTGPNHLRVVNCGNRYRHPCRRRFLMTEFASITAIDVRWPFATCCHPIVTTDAVIEKRRVIHYRWYPRDNRMTGIAFLCGDNMRRSFTGGDDIVVACRADSNDFVMIHRTVCQRRPGCRRRLMARFTNISSINV